MTASTLAAAGIPIPEPFHGRPLFGPGARPRDFIVTARDRCDETVDRIRAVRDRRYKYIRNFMPERPYTQPNAYIEESYPTQRVMKELHAAGKLNAVAGAVDGPAEAAGGVLRYAERSVRGAKSGRVARARPAGREVLQEAGRLDGGDERPGAATRSRRRRERFKPSSEPAR